MRAICTETGPMHHLSDAPGSVTSVEYVRHESPRPSHNDHCGSGRTDGPEERASYGRSHVHTSHDVTQSQGSVVQMGQTRSQRRR